MLKPERELASVLSKKKKNSRRKLAHTCMNQLQNERVWGADSAEIAPRDIGKVVVVMIVVMLANSYDVAGPFDGPARCGVGVVGLTGMHSIVP